MPTPFPPGFITGLSYDMGNREAMNEAVVRKDWREMARHKPSLRVHLSTGAVLSCASSTPGLMEFFEKLRHELESRTKNGPIPHVFDNGGSGTTCIRCGQTWDDHKRHKAPAPDGARKTAWDLVDQDDDFFVLEDMKLQSEPLPADACTTCRGQGFISGVNGFGDPYDDPCEACSGTGHG